MDFIVHTEGNTKAVEVISDEILIDSEQAALDIMANIGYLHNSDKIILDKKNLDEDFFNLKTGLAGDILQKFSNYRVQLAITGDFTQYKSKSLKDFIMESNKNRQILFLANVHVAIKELCSGN